MPPISHALTPALAGNSDGLGELEETVVEEGRAEDERVAEDERWGLGDPSEKPAVGWKKYDAGRTNDCI
jgi:hypothetical protein